MKRLALALLIAILSAPAALSYVVITDPETFYSMYEDPAIVIEFTELKDGTAIENLLVRHKPQTFLVSDSNDNCLMPADEKGDEDIPASLAVRSQAFLDHWSFRGADPATPGLFCEFIIWFVQGITSGPYHMAVSVAVDHCEPFAMYTNTGFIGVIPSSPQETDFIFYTFNTVFGFETGYSQSAPAPETILIPEKERTVFAGLSRKRFEE